MEEAMTNHEERRLMIDKLKRINERINTEIVDPNGMIDPITDGPVNLDEYLNSGHRVLWILKEPYDETDGGVASGGGWSLTEGFLNQPDIYDRIGKSNKTWYPIIYVNHGIFQGHGTRWDDLDDVPKKHDMALIMKKVAVINLKKLPGLTKSDMNVVAEAYIKHRDIIMEQIDALAPWIVIFAGSAIEPLKQDLGISDQKGVKEGHCTIYVKNGRTYIAGYHPAQTQLTQQVYVDDMLQAIETGRLLSHLKK